jgi:hypothetical protein
VILVLCQVAEVVICIIKCQEHSSLSDQVAELSEELARVRSLSEKTTSERRHIVEELTAAKKVKYLVIYLYFNLHNYAFVTDITIIPNTVKQL